MRKEILEVLKKHDVQIYDLYHEDFFTVVLKTDKPENPELLTDLKAVLVGIISIHHERITKENVRREPLKWCGCPGCEAYSFMGERQDAGNVV